MKKPHPFDELARKCAAEGRSIAVTATMCGRSFSTIYKWAMQNGVEFWRPGQVDGVRARGQVDGVRARELAAKGASKTRAARELGVSVDTLRKWSRDNGVEFVDQTGWRAPGSIKGRGHSNRIEVSISMAPDEFETLKAAAVAESLPFSRVVTQLALRQVELLARLCGD